MYICIDIGGTKTLLCSVTNDGVITEEIKFPTAKKYADFVKDLKENAEKLENKEFKAGGLGMPGPGLDRENGVGLNYANIPWLNVPVQHDVEKTFNCPFAIENDAKLAGLSEAMLLKDKYKRVLYVTVSTGIGYGLVVNCHIDSNVGDSGGSAILLEHDGKMMPWEDFASGSAIVERYGKRAEAITDEDTWKRISADLARGFIHLIAITMPEVVVIGGGVGNYFERFGKLLEDDIKAYSLPFIDMPKLIKAQRPDEAVIYGCYDLAKQVYGSS